MSQDELQNQIAELHWIKSNLDAAGASSLSDVIAEIIAILAKALK